MKIDGNDLSNIMAFNEQSARKIIEFLLKDDCYEFKRWLKQIKKFNVEQIKNLLEGNNENLDIYQIKNKEIFDKLVQKFDNFSQITLKWYENEENYQYLKQLWINYICIEDINEKIKNEQELADYLESNHVPYSKWPDKVKEDFKEAAEDTIGTYIHEEDIKMTLIQQHSMFRNCFEAIENLLNSLGNIITDAESEAEKKFKDLGKSSSKLMLNGLFGIVAGPIIASDKTTSKNRLEKLLSKELKEYIPDKCTAKNVAINTIKNCEKTEGTLKFEAIEPEYRVSNDIDTKITLVFKSKMVCGAVAIASVINLGLSIIEFLQISKLTKTIAGKSYSDKLEKIKQRFKSHIAEIDISNIDDPLLVQKINYFKSNIELDKESLTQLLVEIKIDIKLLEQKKKESIIEACASGALVVVSAVGTVITTGGMSFLYGLSTLGNIISGGTYILNACDCINLIDDLIKIQEEAKKESDEIEKQIKKLNLVLNQKELHFPNFYNALSEILEKEKIKGEKFRF